VLLYKAHASSVATAHTRNDPRSRPAHDPRPPSLKMIFGWLTPLLTLAAFILLLLVTLSTPIIKSIYLYKVVANISGAGGLVSITGNARFGVWGYCTSAITGKFVAGSL
jgi:hypothetical protein